MVDVTVQADRVACEVEGLDQLWALRSRLEIPHAHITDVKANADQVGCWRTGRRFAQGIFGAAISEAPTIGGARTGLASARRHRGDVQARDDVCGGNAPDFAQLTSFSL
jgi:hypothetical protein